MYILISATIILWLTVVTIIYKLNKMNSLLLDCQRDVVDLLYKTRAIDDWIDKQAELKMLTLNPDTINKRLNQIKFNFEEIGERVSRTEFSIDKLEEYREGLDKIEKLLSGDHPAPIAKRLNMLERKTFGLRLDHRDDGVYISNKVVGYKLDDLKKYVYKLEDRMNKKIEEMR